MEAGEAKTKAFGGQDVVLARYEVRNQAHVGRFFLENANVFTIELTSICGNAYVSSCKFANNTGNVDVFSTKTLCLHRNAHVFPLKNNMNSWNTCAFPTTDVGNRTVFHMRFLSNSNTIVL